MNLVQAAAAGDVAQMALVHQRGATQNGMALVTALENDHLDAARLAGKWLAGGCGLLTDPFGAPSAEFTFSAALQAANTAEAIGVVMSVCFWAKAASAFPLPPPRVKFAGKRG